MVSIYLRLGQERGVLLTPRLRRGMPMSDRTSEHSAVTMEPIADVLEPRG